MNLTEKEIKARKMVCLPLDGLEGMHDLVARVNELSPVVGLFKIGKETYTRYGPKAVEIVHDSGAKVFLDLKYHDIPNTVKGAAKAAAELGVYMFNVHASGGLEMMRAAVEGAESGSSFSALNPRPRIVGVTVLTSLDSLRYVQNSLPVIKALPLNSELRFYVAQLSAFPFADAINADMAISKEKDNEIKLKLQRAYLEKFGKPFDLLIRNLGLENLVSDSVLNFARMANSVNLDGVVCSAADLYAIRDKLPKDFTYVTPGIKGVNTPAGADQKRVFTPGNAVQDGSSILVIGRAITDPKTSEARLQAGYEILQDMAEYL